MPAPLTPRRLNPSDPKLLKLTEDTLAEGLSLPTLATRLGTTHTTVYNWVNQAEAELAGSPAQPELGSTVAFSEAIERGLQRFESENVDTIAGARSPKPGGWQLLPHIYPRTTRPNCITGPGTASYRHQG